MKHLKASAALIPAEALYLSGWFGEERIRQVKAV
jgi:hypothetical protein